MWSKSIYWIFFIKQLRILQCKRNIFGRKLQSRCFSCKIDDSRDSTNLIPQSLNILASCKTFTDLPVSIALVHWLLNFSRTVALPDGETAPSFMSRKKQRKSRCGEKDVVQGRHDWVFLGRDVYRTDRWEKFPKRWKPNTFCFVFERHVITYLLA